MDSEPPRAGALCPAELSQMGTEQVTVLRSTARGHRPWFIAQGGDSALTLPTPRTTRALNALVSLPCNVCTLLGCPKLLKRLLRTLLPSGKTPRRGINSPVVRHRGQVEALWGEADRPQGAGVDVAAVIQRRVQGDVAAGGKTRSARAPGLVQPHQTPPDTSLPRSCGPPHPPSSVPQRPQLLPRVGVPHDDAGVVGGGDEER